MSTQEANETPALNLEARLDRLDAIARSMEGDELTLDASMELFEEAVRHLRSVEESLGNAQVRVDELIGRVGATELRPLDTDDL